jgi:HEAT repeat protein
MAQIIFPTGTADIIAQLSDWNPRSRHEARKKLVHMGDTALPILMEQLSSKDWHVRWEAVKALGELKNPLSNEAIVCMLWDEDTGVRFAAMGSLIALSRASIEPLMLALTEHSTSAPLRHGAHYVLRALHGKQMLTNLEIEVMRALEGPHPGIEAAHAANRVLIAEFPLTTREIM